MSDSLKNFLKFIVFLSLGLGILYLVFSRAEITWADLVASLSEIKYSWFIAACFIALLSHFIRGLRWRQLLKVADKEPTITNSFFAIIIAYLLNLAIPRSGEVVRCAYVNRTENIALDKALGTAIVDRATDVFMLLVLVLIALVIEFEIIKENVIIPLGAKLGGILGNWAIYLIAAIGIGMLVALWKFRGQLQEIGLVKKVSGFVEGIFNGLKSVLLLKRPGLYIVYSFAIWFLYLLMLYFCMKGYPPTDHLSMKAGLTVLVMATFGMLVPTPGGMGAFHAAAIFALVSFYGIDEGPAGIFSMLAYVSQQGLVLVVGILSLLISPFYNQIRRKKNES